MYAVGFMLQGLGFSLKVYACSTRGRSSPLHHSPNKDFTVYWVNSSKVHGGVILNSTSNSICNSLNPARV